VLSKKQNLCYYNRSVYKLGPAQLRGVGTGALVHFHLSDDQEIWRIKNRPCALCNPLKSHKTAKGIFGNVWRLQGENLEKLGPGLEMFGEGLEKLAPANRTPVSGAELCAPFLAFVSRETRRKP
jgi:hypothetical protein